MADVPVTVQDVPSGGLDPTFLDDTEILAANSYLIPNNGRVAVIVRDNTAQASVTVETPRTDPEGNAIADKVFTIPIGGMILPFLSPNVYNDRDGNMKLTFTSGLSGIEVAAVRF